MIGADISHTPGVMSRLVLQGDDLIASTTQDCVPIAERAKEMHLTGQHGSKDMRLAASIPFVMIEAYLTRHNLTLNEFQRDKSHIRAMVNDPALAHFRVWPGKV
jgi:hypothetical protein